MKKLAVLIVLAMVVVGSSCLKEQPTTQPAIVEPVLEQSTTDTMQTDYKAGNPTDYSQQENQQQQPSEQKPTDNPYLKPPVSDDRVSYSTGGGGGGGSDWQTTTYVVPQVVVIWQGTVKFKEE